MSFPIDHWNDPRASIANGFEHNDLGYATSGMRAAAAVLHILDMPLAELQTKWLLDFGCGTGRISRPLSYFFKFTKAYDPNRECIRLAISETRKCNVPAHGKQPERSGCPRLVFVDSLDLSPEYDVVCCTVTLPHLTPDEQAAAITQMLACLKPGGVAVLHYRPEYCEQLIADLWGEDPNPNPDGTTQLGIYRKES